jgi:hypothetical protein
MSFLKLSKALIFLPCLSIVACGGGGDEGADTAKPPVVIAPPLLPFEVVLLDTPAYVNELEGATIKLHYTNNLAPVTLSVVAQSSGINEGAYTISTDAGSGTVLVSVNEILNDGKLALTIVAQDGVSASRKVSLQAIVNTSAIAKIGQFSAYKKSADEIKQLTAEQRLFNAWLDLSYFSGVISNTEKSSMKSQFSSTIQHQNFALLEALLKDEQLINQYRLNALDELAIDRHLIQIADAISNYTFAANNYLNSVFERYGAGVFPSLSFGKYYFAKDFSKISQFIGNPQLGSYSDDVWSFKQDYAFLAELTSSTTFTCIAL